MTQGEWVGSFLLGSVAWDMANWGLLLGCSPILLMLVAATFSSGVVLVGGTELAVVERR